MEEPELKLELIEVLKPWKQKIKDLLLTEPDNRTIHWFYSTEYGIGKTEFIKYAITTIPGLIYNLKSQDVFKDIKNKFKKDILDFNGILFNIHAGDKFNYSILEPLKDGMLFGGRCKSKLLLFNSPHVIIFSSEYIDFDNDIIKEMDKERFKVYKYKKDIDDFKLRKIK